TDCNDHRYRHHHRGFTLSINITAAHQNQGYGFEAINWALDWAFRFAGAHNVGLSTVEYNLRARRLYEKIGFVFEGRFREDHYHDRKWYDVLFYSMLEHEWEARRSLKTQEE